MKQSLVALLCALLLAGCPPVNLISDYDEKIDQGVTDLQRRVEKILAKLESAPRNPPATYRASDYADLKQDLNVLITRASSWEKNDLTVKQLHLLGYALLDDPPMAPESLKLPGPPEGLSLERRHQNKEPLEKEDIRDLRAILSANFRSILKLELAKKLRTGAGSDQK